MDGTPCLVDSEVSMTPKSLNIIGHLKVQPADGTQMTQTTHMNAGWVNNAHNRGVGQDSHERFTIKSTKFPSRDQP